eukprot:2810945-Rhodomonas_salina.1
MGMAFRSVNGSAVRENGSAASRNSSAAAKNGSNGRRKEGGPAARVEREGADKHVAPLAPCRGVLLRALRSAARRGE